MQDQDDNMQNNEEYIENYEENENVGEMNLGEEEYEEENMNENGEEEEGQNVYGFDIQINEDSYLLVIGKTDENKLLFRLLDKEDENKPFFQNDFSLEDLRNINPFFNNIDDENLALQYIINNLNDAVKEIKILDEEKIQLSISISDEELKIDMNFELFKTLNDLEGEEEIQNQLLISNNYEDNEHINEGEQEIEEGVENNEGEDQLEEGEENPKKLRPKEEMRNNSGKVNPLSSNLPLQIDQQNINSKLIEKKEVVKKNENGVETIVEKKEITRISNKNKDDPEERKEVIITETKVKPGQKEEIRQSNKESIKKEPQQIQHAEQIENIIQNNSEEMMLLKEELLNTINALNENFNNQLLKQNELIMNIQKEMKEENEKKINEMKNSLNKKDNDLNDLKNKFENLNKKMTDIENKLNENKKAINGYDMKINEINNKVDNINEKVKNINNVVNEAIENNNKKIKLDIDDISKQMNEKLKMRKSIEKEPVKEEPKNTTNNNYDDIIKGLSTNLQNTENQLGEIKNELEIYQNKNINNIKIIENKLNSLEKKLEKNNIALVNIENENKNKAPNQNYEEDINKINIKLNDINNSFAEFESRFKNLENNLNNLNSTNKKDIQDKNFETTSKLGNFQNMINNFDTKLKNLENNMKNISQKSPKKEQNLDLYNKKIAELENYAKGIEAKINDYEIDNIIQNLSILMEKQNDTEIYDKINNIEAEINELREKANKPNVELRKSTDMKANAEITNKISNIEKIISLYENQFKKIEDEKLNNNNYKSNNDKRADKLEKRIANVSKQSDDLEIKIDQLFNKTRDLENFSKNLDKKTNELVNNATKISKETNAEKLRNIKSERANNYTYMDNNQSPKYNKININRNVVQGNVYQPMNKTRQKENYQIENQYNNNNNPHIRNMANNNTYGESNYSYSAQIESNHIESRIVNDNEIQFLINRIREIHPRINNIYFNLVYRASEDGDKAADFHKKCDKIGPNITLIKTKKGYIFGGFTFKNWEHMPRDIDINKPNLGSASRDSRAFGFSVSNQKVYNNEKPNEFAIWCNRNFGPTFKNNLFQIFDSCLRKGGYCSIRSNSHFGGQLYDYEISGGESRFRVEELEIYEIKLH